MEIVLTLLSALCKQLQGIPSQTLLTYFGMVIIMIMVNVRALKGLNMFLPPLIILIFVILIGYYKYLQMTN